MTPLFACPQWIVVLLVPQAGGKAGKLPIDHRTGLVTEKGSDGAHDPAIWLPYEHARAYAAAMGPGYTVGFVLTAADPFFCVDLDNARQGDAWSPLAQHLVASLPGCCVEVSQSGRGLHIWGRGAVPPHSKKNVPLHIELYTERRFIAIGTDAVGEMAEECPQIAAVAAQYFPPREAVGEIPEEGPRADWRGPADDDELLRRALQSKSAASVFGGGNVSFADLWNAEAASLGRKWPGEARPFDASSADMALAQHLAFWTGCDAARIERLMQRSALKRDKWEREDYLQRTIAGACAQQRDVLQDKPMEMPAEAAEAPTGAPQMRRVEGATFLSPEQQADLFAGCVYVIDRHQVLIPGGKMLKPDQFKAKFGGYTFAMDTRNERTTRNAFEAFTESQALKAPRADEACFKPQRPYGEITREGGVSRVNTWWPVEVRKVKGDASPFLQHLARLLPDRRDALIALSYAAACVQHQGVKFPWAIVLQGVEGNGKTLISQCVATAIGRRYVHWPKASKLSNQFNAWMVGRLLYCVEDIFTSEKRVDVIEELKPMITGGEGLEIEGKGVDQISAEICGNFIFNTNHPAGLKKTRNDRRFCWLATAQQSADHLARDGLTNDYFIRFRHWLEHEDGYAIVADLLATYAIPDEFNPATGCPRAPRTTSTEAAIEQSLGRVEQEVLAAVDRGAPGFAGGWISSIMLDNLLQSRNLWRDVPPKARPAMLDSLGYVPHPALASNNGQVNHPVKPDGAKPKLYVRRDSPLGAIAKPAEVGRAYADAQRAMT